MQNQESHCKYIYIELYDGKIYLSIDAAMRSLEVMSSYIRYAPVELILMSSSLEHPEINLFLGRAKSLGFNITTEATDTKYKNILDTFSVKEVDLPTRDRIVCPYIRDTIVIRSSGAIYPCPINRSKDIMFKGSAIPDISLIYIYETDIQLKKSLMDGIPRESCLSYCRKPWANTQTESQKQ